MMAGQEVITEMSDEYLELHNQVLYTQLGLWVIEYVLGDDRRAAAWNATFFTTARLMVLMEKIQ
jgi:hypothetical protein